MCLSSVVRQTTAQTGISPQSCAPQAARRCHTRLEVHNCSTPKPVNRSAAALVANKRFKCTECGKCCTGSGEVYVNMAECSAIASHLRIPLDHFLETYCEQSANALGGRQLKSKDTLDKDCVFLEDKLCTVYQVRPVQCSTYPWWPSLMDPVSWGIEGAEVCEGFDHEDADAVDVQHASEQLLKAAEYFANR
ncbi:hypothetical protein ABBQ32_005458 [Trebouxia sp. C0010 RCD-2024]